MFTTGLVYIYLQMKINVQESKTILHLMFLFNCDLIHGYNIFKKIPSSYVCVYMTQVVHTILILIRLVFVFSHAFVIYSISHNT